MVLPQVQGRKCRDYNHYPWLSASADHLFEQACSQLKWDKLMHLRVATKIFGDFGGALYEEFITGWEPVSTVHYTSPGSSISGPSPKNLRRIFVATLLRSVSNCQGLPKNMASIAEKSSTIREVSRGSTWSSPRGWVLSLSLSNLNERGSGGGISWSDLAGGLVVQTQNT